MDGWVQTASSDVIGVGKGVGLYLPNLFNAIMIEFDGLPRTGPLTATVTRTATQGTVSIRTKIQKVGISLPMLTQHR